MHLTLRLVCAAIALLMAPPATAACVLAGGAATFATSSSYAVRSSSVAQVNASAGLTCNGSVIQLLSNNSARARVTSANGFRLGNSNGDRIDYSVSADPGGTFRFTQGGAIDYFSPSLLSLASILDGGNFTPRIYASLSGAANVAAGTYTDTLTVQWNWQICRGIGVLGVCILADNGSGTATITVSIVVTRDCRIDAPPLSFGTASLVSQFVEVTQTIRADCTKGTSYAVSLTSGSSGSARPWRAMNGPAGNLRYNLYRSDGTTIWDESNPLASTAPGTGNPSPVNSFVYRARIDPTQPTPPPGSYNDLVSVLIAF